MTFRSISRILVIVLLLTACADDEPDSVHAARGELIGVAGGGTALIVHHEEIEGVMGSMTMTLRFWSEEDREAFGELDARQGDAIAFELIQADDVYIRNVELLGDNVELDLPEPPSPNEVEG